MRKLYYIPIIHSQIDMGSVGSELSKSGEIKYGKELWMNHIEEVDKSWNKIKSFINRQLKNISFDKVKIYQDGLPITGEIGIKLLRILSIKEVRIIK